MDELGIDMSILSYPAIPSGTISEENRQAARARNEFAFDICCKHPTRFGFFATLPFLDDIEGEQVRRKFEVNVLKANSSGCLNEIAFALDDLNADGVSLASSYSQGQSASKFKFSTD
jgi:predicted TIM-barrel fold metal-dependent hydrolase